MRIRTVKPDLFRHRELYDLEQETTLPVRIAFVGLFGICDREGRFEWKPEVIKLDVLPFDSLDFAWVLDALAARGFLVKYRKKLPQDQSTETHVTARAEKCFGQIPSFLLHQRPNLREAKSNLPAPRGDYEVVAVSFPTIPDRTETHVHAPGEGKGREVEREQEGEGEVFAGVLDKTSISPKRKSSVRAGKGGDSNPDGASATALAWRSYRDAFADKYGKAPPWNSKTAGQLKSLVSRIPAEAAPSVAAFYLTHPGARYAAAMHPVGLLLMDAEKLYTEWQTGRTMTGAQARQGEKAAGYKSQLDRIRAGEL